jgi:hypothetical protein
MAMSYGNVVAQGILGGVMGAARGVAQNAQEEQRIEAERLKEERLSKLRLGEYKAKAEFDQQQKDIVTARDEKDTADFYARTGPQTKASTYTDATGDATEGASAGAVTSERTETAREVADRRAEEARKTGKKGIIEATRADRELEERREERSLDRADRKADREERNADRKEAREDRGAARADLRADREEARRVQERIAQQAQEGRWQVDRDGNYRRPDGSLVTEEIREGGRLLGTRPIKAPESKVSGVDWKMREDLDSINRRIEVAERNGDEALVTKLLDEKDKLLGKTKPKASSASTSNRPPLSSFQR